MGARWYDGYLNRWLSADTIVPEPASPQSFNRYSYALGNPLKYRDPSGHQGCAADDCACWERRWYQAHGYEWLESGWVYTGNYVFADKLAFGELLADITNGYHSPTQFTGFTLTEGALTFSLVQRGQDNFWSTLLSTFAIAADTIDFAFTGSFAVAYTIVEGASTYAGGPPGGAAALLTGDVAYKAVNTWLLGVDLAALTLVAGSDIASGRSGIDQSAGQAWIGLDTLMSTSTLGISAGSMLIPVAVGTYVSLAGDTLQMTYDFFRSMGILSGWSLQVQW